jgi:hypothetical protein
MQSEAIDFFYGKIASIPLEKYDDLTIALLEKFALTIQTRLISQSSYASIVSNVLSKTKKLAVAQKYEGFALKALYEAVLDSSKLQSKYITQAFQSLTFLLKNENFAKEREKYLVATFDNFKKGVSIPQSTVLFLHILSTFPQTRFLKNESIEEYLQKFRKDCNICDLIVLNFENYLREVRDIIDKSPNRSENPAQQVHILPF